MKRGRTYRHDPDRPTRKVCVMPSKDPAYSASEVHQQEYGNRNFVLVHTRCRGKKCRIVEGGRTYTVFTKDKDCKRGEYAEELDIESPSRSRAAIKRIAEAVLAVEYEPGLRVTKIVERFGIFW